MADWSALVKGFQEGADWSQRRRYNKQMEMAREQALKAGGRELYALAGAEQDLLNQFPTETSGMTPYDDSIWELEDPMAVRLKNKFKSWMQKKGKKKRQKALDLGGEGEFNTSNPVGTGEEGYTPAETYALPETDEVEAVPFADGGDIANAMEAARGVTQTFATQAGQAPVTTVQAGGAQPVPSVTGVIDTGRNYADGGSIAEVKDRRKASAKEVARGTDRFKETRSTRKALDVGPKETAYSRANRVTGEFMQTRPLPQDGRTGLARLARGARNLGRMVKGAGALGALGATAIEAYNTPTEQFRERFGLETDDPSLPGDIGVRALGAASVLGDVFTLGAAGRLYRDKQRIAAEQQQAAAGATPQQAQAIPVEQPPAVIKALTVTGRRQQGIPTQQTGTDLDVVDFSNIDIDAREVPDMKTDDWKQYRAMVIRDAARRGQPIDQVQDRITQMQMKGFLSYGYQGLALQQAGNVRGAMAAYRAAFQYFPNGNDVEFGTSVNKRTGRTQIIGFAKDEKTGKIVPGSELVMDPERVSVILENFKNPQAFRLWTKDWRDFQQEQRKYEEVTKPLAQAQADYMATNSEANVLRAENAALRARGGYDAADMRGDATAFRNAPGLSELMLTEPEKAQYLLSAMGQIKAANPNVPPDTIATVVMQSYADGTLEQRLQRMGIQ